MIMIGLSNPLYQVGADAMLADIIPAEKRTDAYAITRIANNAAFALGPAVGGFLATRSYHLAFYGASGEATEAFNDYRRLKALGEEAFIGLANPLNAQNKFPLRFPYGNSDVSANPNIKTAYGDGSYIYTENVWWAGGTR